MRRITALLSLLVMAIPTSSVAMACCGGSQVTTSSRFSEAAVAVVRVPIRATRPTGECSQHSRSHKTAVAMSKNRPTYISCARACHLKEEISLPSFAVKSSIAVNQRATLRQNVALVADHAGQSSDVFNALPVLNLPLSALATPLRI